MPFASWGLGPMLLQATTGVAGYTLVNGTGTIISWTAPNDGALHRVFLIVTMDVTSAETGGATQMAWNAPDGTAGTFSPLGGGLAAAVTGAQQARIVQAGSTFTYSQSTALTAGASKLWAEIWGQ